MRYLLPANKTLILKGPATLSLIDGQATILESPLDKSARLVIQQEKQLPIESEDEAEVEITLGETGSISEIEGSSLPKSWKDAIDSLEQIRTGIAMIIGPAEVGKSALCTYVMNALLNRKCSVRVVDADIGQADVGPPTTIASSTPILPKPTLSSLEPERMFFVGHNTPGFVQSKVIHGIKRMLNSDNNLTIINTDGWILGSEAITYKNHLISTVKPDILVGIGSEDSLNPILHTTTSHSILVEASRVILQRTRSDRKELRKIGYRRFLNGSTVHTLKLNDVKMQVRKSLRPEALVTGNLDLRNVLLGFLTDKGFLDQIGILERMTPSHLTVYSKAIRQPLNLELGHIRLSRDGSELGFLG